MTSESGLPALDVICELQVSAVYVIESLRTGDKATGIVADKRTGEILHANTISPLGRSNRLHVPWFVQQVRTRTELVSVFSSILSQTRQYNLAPIVHIEAHGNVDGVELSNGELIAWNDLASMLGPINDASRNMLFVVLAACEGAYFIKALTRCFSFPPTHPLSGRTPIWGLMGPTDQVDSQRLLEGMTKFYDCLLGKKDVNAALVAVDSCFSSYCAICEVVFAKAFGEYISNCLHYDTTDRRVSSIHSLSGKNPTAIRREIFRFEESYYAMRAKFLWLDKYPQEAQRFSLDYKRMITLTGGGRAGDGAS